MASADADAELAALVSPGTRLRSGKYEVVRVLGRGSFGCVVEARDVRTGGALAIKVEAEDSGFHQLAIEARVLNEVQSFGFPKLVELSRTPDGRHNLLAMQLLRGQVEGLVREQPGRRLPVAVVHAMGTHLLQRLDTMHAAGFAYRDLKPANLMWHAASAAEPLDSPARVLYLIDFGLTKRVVGLDGVHIPPSGGRRGVTGTPLYVAVHGHDGQQLSRRDDIESAAYVLAHLATGTLPWAGMPASTPEALDRIGDQKRAATPDQVAYGLPRCFHLLLEYARTLRFEDAPNYSYLADMWAAEGEAGLTRPARLPAGR